MLNPIMSQHIYLTWRNGLARWISNPKFVGSIPTEGAYYYILGKVEF